MLVEGNIGMSSCCSAFEFCSERPHTNNPFFFLPIKKVIGSVAETYTKDLQNCS